MPSVAVNPLDPQHVVIAYMDYSLVDTGYAGIGVAVSTTAGLPGNILDRAARSLRPRGRQPDREV